MPRPFVHLAVHTEYSLVDSVVRIKPAIKAAAAAQMPALAMADHINLFGLVKFYRAALDAGVKPLVGVDVRLLMPNAKQSTRLTLFAMNNDGYRHLAELISRCFVEGQDAELTPVLRYDWLVEKQAGLIVLSGGLEGELGQLVNAGHLAAARDTAQRWQALFGDRFYIQLQRTGKPNQEAYIQAVAPLAAELGIPLVATNDVRFIEASDFETHETRVAIHDGYTLADPRRPKNYTEQQYLRSPAEMEELFADLPEALDNTVAIAQRCNVTLQLGKSFLPDFEVPAGHTVATYLVEQSELGLQERLEQKWQLDKLEGRDYDVDEDRRVYAERLKVELDVIVGMDFPGYFMIVADFIQWAKANEIPVGPGRGSGAGSLVAYVLKITDLDPLKYELLFERFLNPERVSMPDFDVDFCMEGRDRVIDYVAQKYGREKVSQIITYGTMAAKASIRDVGRVFGLPFGQVDKVAKMIPNDVGMTLDKALEENEELKQRIDEDDEEVAPLYHGAKALEGIARNVGKHAGGVVIAPSKLTDFTPLYCEAGTDQYVTQFDKDDVEAAGLVKFDFLGLRTLTIIDWALKSINARKAARDEAPLDINTVGLGDDETYELLQSGRTTAVFQLESGGMQRLLTQLKPDNFEDIVALVALFRPGPLGSGMVEDFVACKHGLQEIQYPHPSLTEILKPTYGVILYQEQVMQIAQVLSGYTLGGADILRRAMGKKKVEVMEQQKAIFVDGAEANGVPRETSAYIFDLIEKFAGYGFNKSHSAAYALLTYQTAWLKKHYPSEFMAAVMSADLDNTDKVVWLIHDANSYDLEVLPPDVNQSQYKFTPVGDRQILYGLGAIKGVGLAAIEGIVQERDLNGPFEDIYQLCERIDLKKTGRKVLVTLIEAGALDQLGANRATLMEQLPKAIHAAEQAAANAAAGQNDMFGLGEVRDMEAPKRDDDIREDWGERERLAAEKAALGLYLTGHPILEYEAEAAKLRSGTIAQLVAQVEAQQPQQQQQKSRDGEERKFRRPKRVPVTTVGWVIGVKLKQGKRATLVLDDRTGRIEVQMFWEDYQKHEQFFATDQLLVVTGGMAYDDFINGYSVSAEHISDIDQVRFERVRGIEIDWFTDASEDSLKQQRHFVSRLQGWLKPYTEHGETPIRICYRGISAMASVMLGKAWRVRPEDALIHQLRKHLGNDAVRVAYGRKVDDAREQKRFEDKAA